jgi:hypothetical protein
VDGIHIKTLIVDDLLYSRGLFNWPPPPFQRKKEVLVHITEWNVNSFKWKGFLEQFSQVQKDVFVVRLQLF